MRLAPRIRPVLIGLPLVVCQLVISRPAVGAWESSKAAEGSNSSVPAAGSLRFVAPVTGPESRFMNSQVPASSSSNVVDPAVQQAGWNGPRRMPSSIGPGHPAAAMLHDEESQRGRKGPMFRGRELRLPGGLFSRDHNADAAETPMFQRQPAGNQLPSASAIHGTRQPAPANAGPHQWSRPKQTNAPVAKGTQRQAQPLNTELRIAERVSAPATKSPQFPSRDAIKSTAADTKPSPAAITPKASVKITTPPNQATRAEQLLAKAHELSRNAETAEQYTQIIDTCRQALASQPGGPIAGYANDLAAWALNRRGQLKAEACQSHEAIRDFEQAIRADADCWRAVHNRGVLLAQVGQFEKAFDDFNRTIQLNPEFAKAYSNRAALFVVANKLNAAAEDYSRAIELDAHLAVAHRGRGRVCHLLGRFDEAISHYDTAVKLAPNDAYAIASRADLLTDLGRYADANAEYNHAIDIDPNSMHAHSGSAWLLATCPNESIRNPALAIERAKKSIRLSGHNDPVNFDTLAAALASAGDFVTAAKTIRQAIAIAAAEERRVYQDRLAMYEHARPYRISPVNSVAQASHVE